MVQAWRSRGRAGRLTQGTCGAPRQSPFWSRGLDPAAAERWCKRRHATIRYRPCSGVPLYCCPPAVLMASAPRWVLGLMRPLSSVSIYKRPLPRATSRAQAIQQNALSSPLPRRDVLTLTLTSFVYKSDPARCLPLSPPKSENSPRQTIHHPPPFLAPTALLLLRKSSPRALCTVAAWPPSTRSWRSRGPPMAFLRHPRPIAGCSPPQARQLMLRDNQ